MLGCASEEMASIGLPVPPGFTLTTEVCTHFYQNDYNYPKELDKQARGLEREVESLPVSFIYSDSHPHSE